MIRFCLLIALVLGLTARAQALESAAVTTPHATVTLVSETDAVEPGKPVRIGLRFRLAPGWHIYWVNPGDAGQAPTLDLALPPGAGASGFDWPVPQRIAEQTVMTFAYTGEVLLPMTVSGLPGDAPVALRGSASWLVCERICVPERGQLSLDLNPGRAAPSPEVPLFQAADAAIPRVSPFAAAIAADGTLTLTGELSRATVADAWFFPMAGDAIVNAAPQTLAIGQGTVSLALQPGAGFDKTAPLPGVVVLKDPSGAETALGITARPGGAPASAAGEGGIAGTLVFAFLGGLILNLMPCVFPVLAMKALAILRLSDVERRVVRAHALWYALGVLAAFGGLAAALLAVRSAGGVAVWGFQFQSPVFVALTCWLLFAVGLSLSGVFAVGGSIAGLGQGLTRHGGHAGSFFTGLLAVLVATPCTAPFMGAAIAAAVAAPAPVTLLTFLVMGLGLAAPYCGLAFVPGLARLLPRPGRWMDILKQALAFPMYAAAAWLVWVMIRLGGETGVELTLAGLVLLGFAGWAYGAGQGGEGRGAWIGRIAAGAALVSALALLRPMADAAPETSTAGLDAGEESFTPARLSALRAEGKPVFVNMTAAWCVTCLVNERVALSPSAVRDAFAVHHVAYLKGDWTRQDPAVTDFLRAHDRDGVPLYLLYPPGAGEPEVLPQVLTESGMLERLGRFKG